MQTHMEQPVITIRDFHSDEDALAFKRLNEEWIERFFRIEAKDAAVLGDPKTYILDKGGHVFMVYAGEKVVGCVLLIAAGNDRYELSKMAISPDLRGMGIGRRLLEYAVKRAREIGADSLFLNSSSKLPNAIHLYESIGFRHVDPKTLPATDYDRTDVFMEMRLKSYCS